MFVWRKTLLILQQSRWINILISHCTTMQLAVKQNQEHWQLGSPQKIYSCFNLYFSICCPKDKPGKSGENRAMMQLNSWEVFQYFTVHKFTSTAVSYHRKTLFVILWRLKDQETKPLNVICYKFEMSWLHATKDYVSYWNKFSSLEHWLEFAYTAFLERPCM